MPNECKNTRCFDPWSGLVVSYNNRCWVNCCVYAGVSDVWKESPDLKNAWNTPWFQRLRNRMASGKLSDSGCRGCNMLSQGTIPTPPKSQGLTPVQKQNLEQAAEHWKRGDTILNSTPVEIFFTFTAACNLNCIMCSQEDIRQYETQPDLKAAPLLKQIDVLERAVKVSLSGGEPLVSPECIKFVKGFALEPRLHNTCLSIISNGLLLNRIMDAIKPLTKFELIISADGIGNSYEAVRKGGRWKTLEKNIDRLLDIKQGLNKSEWSLSFNYIVMRQTLSCLPEFLNFALARDFSQIHLMRLDPTRNTFDQDIYRNPDALYAVPNWEESLKESIKICKEYHQPDLVSAIQSIRDLLSNLREPDLSVYPCATPLNLLSNEKVNGKRVLLWGTGGYYRHHFSEWVKNNKNNFTFLGFADNDRSKWGSMIDGHQVYPPQEAAAKKPDLVVLAVTRQFRDIIRLQLKNELGISSGII